jgi:hypothetical protein
VKSRSAETGATPAFSKTNFSESGQWFADIVVWKKGPQALA